jgi:branched-chain amino acid transport system permease protein
VEPIVVLVGALILLALPIYLPGFWLGVGLFSMSAALGAIGLNLLMGTAGQLSLGHAFFVAVGAYGYAWFAGDSGTQGVVNVSGLGLPPLLALVLAIVLAGLAGALFSPISGRMRGLYLAVATLALVYIGHYVMLNATPITAGFNGRDIPDMQIFGFAFANHSPDPGSLLILGVPYGRLERLWYLGLILVALGWWLARNILRGRPGRALAALRDNDLAASVMGVPVTRYRAAAFTLSSMFAGAAGAFLGLVYQRIVPDSFGIMVSINFVAMIVIGGLGSVGGAVAGAFFVSALPLVLEHYAGSLPLVVPAGAEATGISPVEASEYLYGIAIIVVLVFAPRGLAGISQTLVTATRRARRLRTESQRISPEEAR